MPELSALVDTGYMCFDVYGKQDDPSSQRWYCLKNSTDYSKICCESSRTFKKRGITAVVYPCRNIFLRKKNAITKYF